MSEEIEKLRKPEKKTTVRYFGDSNKVKSDDAEHISVSSKKKPIHFSGEVIQVQEKAKFFAKSKWDNRRPQNTQNLLRKRKKNLVQIEVDPYAKDRHSRKYFQLEFQ